MEGTIFVISYVGYMYFQACNLSFADEIA